MRIESLCNGPFETFTETSGSGGLHVFFNASPAAEALNKSVARCFVVDGVRVGIDTRGKGGAIFVAPSTYTCEEVFSYVVRSPTKDLPTIEMPLPLTEHLFSLLPSPSVAIPRFFGL
jgi:hypothetical protein